MTRTIWAGTTNAAADYNRWYFDAGSNGTSTTGNYSSFKIFETAGTTSDLYNVQLVHEHEEMKFTNITFEQWTYNGIKFAALPGTRPRRPHQLHDFRYDHGKYDPILGPTQRLAPLDEELEIDTKKALRHLRRLLCNPRYRKWQLKMVNSVNKRMGLGEVTFNEQAVRNRLTHNLDLLRKAKIQKKHMLEAQKTAEELLRRFIPEELQVELETKRRIEIIARNGNIYELLEDGRVNKLLPDGQKQGLCIYPMKGPYPVADVILSKKLMLETNPDGFEAIAHKTTPFQLAKVTP